MNVRIELIVVGTAFFVSFANLSAYADQVSEFDESAISSLEESAANQAVPTALATALEAFAATNDSAVKASKWEEVVDAAGGGFLSATWPAPQDGWKLLTFPESGNLTLQEVREQSWNKAYYTKLAAQNETEAVQMRGAGALLYAAASGGEQWASILLLDIAGRPDCNLKWLTYWFTHDFAIDWKAKGEAEVDVQVPDWPVEWNNWQQVFNAANTVGKAIVLRNVTMLAIRRNEFVTAGTINLAALSGADRGVKAIALSFGHPAFGPAVTAKWGEIASDASDPIMQALAQEVRAKFQITD